MLEIYLDIFNSQTCHMLPVTLKRVPRFGCNPGLSEYLMLQLKLLVLLALFV